MDSKIKINNFPRFFAQLIIIAFGVLQLLTLPRLPRSMDIYYHLQVAWGFIQAGGYSAWDFWEFLPLGRPHIYPPLFHLILALLLKAGLNGIFLAKFFEAVTPVVFLLVVWNFLRKQYTELFGFFTVLALGSSFAFFLSLINHLPSTIALIFGFLSLGEFFKARSLRATILLVLCFYTHISVPWFFIFTYMFYALIDKEHRAAARKVVGFSILASLPLLSQQLSQAPMMLLVNYDLADHFNLQAKLVEYIFAAAGLFLALRSLPKYKLLISIFLASFIFLAYPHRYLIGEGYIPVILFSALAMQSLWQGLNKQKIRKMVVGALLVSIFFVSPTLFLHKPDFQSKVSYRIQFMDSAFYGLLFAKGSTIWFPWAYIPAVKIIQANSDSRDIVYSDINLTGVILSSLSQRATANALLPESISTPQIDPFAVSSVIVLSKDLDQGFVERLTDKYHLAKLGESGYFTVFRNLAPGFKLKIPKAVIGFPVFLAIVLLLAGLFWSRQLSRLFLVFKG
jgi:hypothetical protein